MEGSETGRGRVWTGVRARRGVDGCGRWCGWKMEGSERGCGRVWTGGDGRWRGGRRGVDGCGRG